MTPYEFLLNFSRSEVTQSPATASTTAAGSTTTATTPSNASWSTSITPTTTTATTTTTAAATTAATTATATTHHQHQTRNWLCNRNRESARPRTNSDQFPGNRIGYRFIRLC